MKANQASRTAEYMALFRAIESSLPASKRLFNDPFAVGFLRPSLRIVVRLSGVPPLGEIINWLIDTKWVVGARAVGVARTRLIDEMLIRALAEGVEQVVILGAGFDSRAYRIDGIRRVRVIEIDHPDTSRTKRAVLLQNYGSLPSHVQFVALDFNRQSLEDAMSDIAFDPNLKTFFLWEGVTNYLTGEAVDATFRAIRRLAERSVVLFTYVDKAVIDSGSAFDGTKKLREVLQNAGERWIFGFNPSELAEYLDRRGFCLSEDYGSVEFRARYWGDRGRHQRGYEFYRVALANSGSI